MLLFVGFVKSAPTTEVEGRWIDSCLTACWMKQRHLIHSTWEAAANEQISQIKRLSCSSCETQCFQLSCSFISLTSPACLGVKLEANWRVVEISVRKQLCSVPKVWTKQEYNCGIVRFFVLFFWPKPKVVLYYSPVCVHASSDWHDRENKLLAQLSSLRMFGELICVS